MMCKQCGENLPSNAIVLMRDWPGRKEAVQRWYPLYKIHVCPMAVKYPNVEAALNDA